MSMGSCCRYVADDILEKATPDDLASQIIRCGEDHSKEPRGLCEAADLMMKSVITDGINASRAIGEREAEYILGCPIHATFQEVAVGPLTSECQMADKAICPALCPLLS